MQARKEHHNSEDTLKTRFALALAAALVLGTTGCGLIVPQATTEEYSPSDGIDVTLPNVDVRNLLLVTSDDSDETNIVFTGVNNGQDPVRLNIAFVADDEQQARETFRIAPGITVFGPADDEQVIVEIPDLLPGSMITAYIESDGTEEERQVPVVDGTLKEYRSLVP